MGYQHTEKILEITYNVTEHVPDDGAQKKQNCDDHNGYENQDQRVLYQSLAILFR
jgi:hypothetical protein